MNTILEITQSILFVKYFKTRMISFSWTPWTVANQAPLFMGFSRQEYWSGLPCPPQGDLPYLPRDWTQVFHIAGRFFTIWATRELPAILGFDLWMYHSHLCFCVTWHFFLCVFVSTLLSSYKDTSHRLGTPLIQYDFSLTCFFFSANTLLDQIPRSWGLGL